MSAWTAALLLAPLATDPTQRWRPSVEIDPRIAIDWALGGREYSVHVLLKPPRSNWRFGADNYGGDTPSAYLMGDAKGWTVRAAAWAVQAQWFPWEHLPGLFVGNFVVAHRWQYRVGDAQTETWRVGITPEVGYQWLPFGATGFYVTPWVGATLDVRVAGSPAISTGQTYPESGFEATPILTLHIGYEF
jgi:hypothetical protein